MIIYFNIYKLYHKKEEKSIKEEQSEQELLESITKMIQGDNTQDNDPHYSDQILFHLMLFLVEYKRYVCLTLQKTYSLFISSFKTFGI